MIAPYTGEAPYCYSNSIWMLLRHHLGPDAAIPDPGIIECLTLMPFGAMAIEVGGGRLIGLMSPLGSAPDRGVDRAVGALGWRCQRTWSDGPERAMRELRAAVERGPVITGPVEMGFLDYRRTKLTALGADHYVVVTAVGPDRVQLHDPAGYPCAETTVKAFLRAWRATSITYAEHAFSMWHDFVAPASGTAPRVLDMVRATLPEAWQCLAANHGDGRMTANGEAIERIAAAIRRRDRALGSFLTSFALAAGARRSLDAAVFFDLARLPDAAERHHHRSRLTTGVRSALLRDRWSEAGAMLDELAGVQHELAAMATRHLASSSR